MKIDDDVLEDMKHIPDYMEDLTVTTEFKFLSLGALLARCAAEIQTLREENARLRGGSRPPKKKVR